MRIATLLSTSLALVACSDEAPAPVPTAPVQRERGDVSRRDVYDAFKAAQRATKHASDGGGRAWLVLPAGESGAVVAGTSGRWAIRYEAGPLGVASGGAVYLQVSPFFEWSTPQTLDEGAPGFTRVTTDADGVALEVQTLDQQLLVAKIRGRALRAGEQLDFEYGAGPAGARADPYAERNSRFWIAVDGDGDGVRQVLADSPGVDVLAGPPALVNATLTSTARPGGGVRLTVALLDARANLVQPCAATIELVDLPEGLELPARIELTPEDRGCKTVAGTAAVEGTFRLAVKASVDGRELETSTNPLRVARAGPRVLWADFHGHTAVSDGTGTPQDYFDFARNAAGLDIVALTDHDHWGMLFVDEHPEIWEQLVATARAFDEPGRFLALPGYEWTNWITGHRHVVYFGDETPLYSSMDERYETPQLLWAALRGKQALVVPHHPGGGPIAIDWRIAPDPEFEPLVEVCSAHGSSEAFDCPRLIHSPLPGHFARDALERGYRLGFVGSGDGHDGHPGLAWRGPHYPTGGLAAVLSEDLTRDGVLAAVRARRTYATSGPRILLRFALGTTRMGGSVSAADLGSAPGLFVQVIGAGPLERVELVLKGEEVLSLPCQGELEFAASATLDELTSGDWIYLRVIQLDGGMAWSSPIFVD